MTRDEFELKAADILEYAEVMRMKRGESYAGIDPTADAHGNFNRIATHLNVSAKFVACVYLLKHVDSIATIVSGGADGGEPLKERVADAINYLLFLETA